MSKFSEFKNIQDDVSKGTCEKSEAKTTEQMEQLIHKYSSYSSDELISEFLKLTFEKKKQGEMSNKELENIQSTLNPYLTDEQKNNMQKLMDVIKRV